MWAAGLFEGEGTCSLANSIKPPRPYAELTSTDKDVVEKFAEIIGVGRIRIKATGHKPAYVWYVQDRDGVIEVIKKLGPFMHERRAEQMRKVLKRAVEMKPYTTRSNSSHDLVKQWQREHR